MPSRNDIRDLQMKLYELRLERESFERDLLKRLPTDHGWRQNIGMVLALKRKELKLIDELRQARREARDAGVVCD